MLHTRNLLRTSILPNKISGCKQPLSLLSMRTGYSSLSNGYTHTKCNVFPTSRIRITFQRRLQSNLKQGEHASKESSEEAAQQSFLQRWLAHKEIPPRGTLKWYGEMTLICTVFAITGTSTMFLVRPAMTNVLGLKGSLKEGPWSYRICSIVIMTPLYSTLLVIVGTVFGRHAYFRHFAVKMFSRFGIPPELMDKNFHKTAKNFRKY